MSDQGDFQRLDQFTGLLTQLERLADMRDRGLLTEEEFQRLKAWLLDLE